MDIAHAIGGGVAFVAGCFILWAAQQNPLPESVRSGWLPRNVAWAEKYDRAMCWIVGCGFLAISLGILVTGIKSPGPAPSPTVAPPAASSAR